MKTITAKHISTADVLVQPKAADVPAMLDAQGVEFNAVDSVNWPAAFPFAPEMRFRIAHTGAAILIEYRVKEDSVRALAADNGNVWEDSCCEFFVIPASDGIYYNIECNCGGNMLIGSGAAKADRVRATADVLDTVDRWTSLEKSLFTTPGKGQFDEADAPKEWSMALVIPVQAFFRHHLNSMSGVHARANFYKCGDALRKPHYLSWNPISLPKPNFHCPDFFGEVYFEE